MRDRYLACGTRRSIAECIDNDTGILKITRIYHPKNNKLNEYSNNDIQSGRIEIDRESSDWWTSIVYLNFNVGAIDISPWYMEYVIINHWSMKNEYELLMCQSDNGHHYATLSDEGSACPPIICLGLTC